ncbi:hypothetical protein M153_6180001514 [Pseudoloma neurophilia]|uniref:Uncharacterized protein n=1 Tax=Pseudoloma neurophilia TaxID=146866 RepID=A0A0R0LWL3_9MICR|nr:hypothetical protein M153_6180001514 [Pseudoloma neurophilia]
MTWVPNKKFKKYKNNMYFKSHLHLIVFYLFMIIFFKCMQFNNYACFLIMISLSFQ